MEEVQQLKETAIKISDRAKFTLHKWHSNLKELEASEPVVSDAAVDQSYANQRLGVRENETKLLGMPWNKSKDTIGVHFPEKFNEENVTKRIVLSEIASIFDPLGLVSPISVLGKMIYRDICEANLPWDEQLSDNLMHRWRNWCTRVPSIIEVPRSLVTHRERIQAIDLHAFGDASGQGTSAAVYAVILQGKGIGQGLITAKSRLAKKGLTIPRLELVSAQMAARLMDNVRSVLEGLPVRHCVGWLDSMVALYWINGSGNYMQFIANRVKVIREKNYISWKHVGTKDNPADIGSRGCNGDQLSEKWLKGPKWLSDPEKWPREVTIEATVETEAEVKKCKEVFMPAVQLEEDRFSAILAKYPYWKTMRITAWVFRFVYNLKKKQQRRRGPLTTNELQPQVLWWLKREQLRFENSDQMREDTQRLNLKKNEEGLLECRGRMQGECPIYIPPESELAKKLVMHEHLRTLHGGVSLTMTAVRENYWIPRLRQLTKKVRSRCNGCKRFQASAFAKPPTGNLPKDRTEGSRPFQVIGVDYAGPFIYKKRAGKEGKAYLLLVGCSLTRAVHLEMLPDMSTEEFMHSFKKLVARRGKPDKVYSDNAKTFVAAAKRVRKISKDEQVHDYLAKNNIKWQFNLSKAPWWGGQYERLIGLVKQAFYKVVGRSSLTWKELEGVILDVEICLNNRPLAYVEDDHELPILTPNAMITGQPSVSVIENDEASEEEELRKRAKHIQRCKKAIWKRWTGEYLRSLRERHNLKHGKMGKSPEVGDVVLIKGEERNRGKWSVGIVEELYEGRDGVVRGAKIKTRKTHIDRAPQHLFPLELHRVEDAKVATENNTLDPDAKEFRPRRNAAVVARERMQEVSNFEDSSS